MWFQIEVTTLGLALQSLHAPVVKNRRYRDQIASFATILCVAGATPAIVIALTVLTSGARIVVFPPRTIREKTLSKDGTNPGPFCSGCILGK